MDNVNNLLEGANPYQVLSEQSAKLAGKWEKSGLLEGIESSTEKNNMSMLLENQAKQLVNESNNLATGGNNTSISAGNSEAWAGVALPLVRRVFGEIVAKDLVSVQPMNLPAGLIFYLDFQYGNTQKGGFTAGDSLYAASADMKKTELNADGSKKALYGAGTYGYSIKDTASTAIYLTGSAHDDEVLLDSLISAATASYGPLDANASASLNYDSDFIATVTMTDVDVIRFSNDSFTNADFNAVRAWEVEGLTNYNQFNRVGTDYVELFVAGAPASGNTAVVNYLTAPDNLNDRGDFEDTNPVTDNDVSSLEIPSIDVQLRSDTVAAKTRKLKAQWTPEFAQDLNAYHSIDAEAELTSILSEYISMEIDLEILDMLIRNADTTSHWSAKIAREVTDTGATTDAATGVYYTKMSWFQTLGVKLQKVSNLIHQKTLRGGANFMVVSPKVSTILESIPGFAADSAGDNNKYAMGVQKVGAINSRYTVYKNPYMLENTILMGYKGSQFLETGAVFAPYIPLIMTPLVYDPISFTPKKGIMTRYAKKMVRPDFYGKVVCHDLDQL
ncbi:hypothetical protein N9Z72_00280 [Akkermansiaceae bacterium]|nr:hypothetical protein [Akkermansiaceae bacterium]